MYFSFKFFSPVRCHVVYLIMAGAFCCQVWPTVVKAQSYSRVDETKSNIDSYYYYVRPGTATVRVHVIGTVKSPGLYEVSDGMDLGTLLALSGGPVLNTRESSNRREVTVQLSRFQSPNRAIIYEAVLGEAVTNPEEPPLLQDGDVITVEIVERRAFHWRDAVTITGAVAALALAIERIASVR